ncbi:MAG: hypothetical protein RJA70_953, partial [Pseudomonadota bacterium]
MIAYRGFNSLARGTALASFILVGVGCTSAEQADVPEGQGSPTGGAGPTATPTMLPPPPTTPPDTSNTAEPPVGPDPTGPVEPEPMPTDKPPVDPPLMMTDVDLNVRGRITDSAGAGIKDCPMKLGTAETLTGADGSYELKMTAKVE